ncbi:MAG: hypothetical protein [Caudoviricetes sp.]|nr:MAG: hypothetical protein [Caudoviricetes sp.]
MTHTWSDVAYGFLVGTDKDLSPAAFMFCIVLFFWFLLKARDRL